MGLGEPFRCRREIIEFPNGLCYQDQPLMPLRQYGADRLSPTVLTRHVPTGFMRDGRDVNPPEAEAVVAQIGACCADPAYAGKTMGVISLVGSDQAKHVESLLVAQLGAAEMERRQLVCGDAYTFQGDERDVMFLSMVSAPNRRIGTLSSARDERRFNVAASRARDQ